MYALLRQLANEEAQRALRASNEHYIRTGKRDTYLDARYEAAERLIDMIDAELTARQRDDVGAPVYFDLYTERDCPVVTESELRLLDGNR
jgi:chromosome condensin MukBEF complex kleisin-like MukF subunit